MQIALLAATLGLLMYAAYRGISVILLAPGCALLAVALAEGPSRIIPMYTDVFLPKTASFLSNYFPIFLLGAIFGKVLEKSGAASAIAASIGRSLGEGKAVLAVVLACAILTYGGVSLFVVVFAVYPIAAALFRAADIPKRLIPGAIALGSFTFTMVALPGTPQIQNAIPAAFFGTTLYAAPILGSLGALLMFGGGYSYLEWRRHRAKDGYCSNGHDEPATLALEAVAIGESLLSFLPLIVVLGVNFGTRHWRGLAGLEVALIAGTLSAVAIRPRRTLAGLNQALHTAVAGSLLAAVNTASEFGFGTVVASLPGFMQVTAALNRSISDAVTHEAVAVNVLAGITGSASGGLSIALGAMGEEFKRRAATGGVDFQVLHRIAAMASGGMDTLPHNGAVITLLVATGLTHRESYRDIFALTCIDTAAVFLCIGFHHLTGLR